MSVEMAVSSSEKLHYFLIEQVVHNRYQLSYFYRYFLPYHSISPRILADLKSVLDLSSCFKIIGTDYLPEQVTEMQEESRDVYIFNDPVKGEDVETFIARFYACGDISQIEKMWYMGDIEFVDYSRVGCGMCSICNPPTECTDACPVCCKTKN